MEHWNKNLKEDLICKQRDIVGSVLQTDDMIRIGIPIFYSKQGKRRIHLDGRKSGYLLIDILPM